MRKTLGAIAIFAFVLAGSTQPGAGPEPAPEDVLFLRTSRGITLVRALPKGVAVNLSEAVPSTDWSAVVQAVRHEDQTRLLTLDSVSGDHLWSRDVDGKLEVKIASEDGRLVALGPRGGTGYAGGRSSTTLVIVGADAPEQTIELAGNYEPEAFSTDGDSLFVVEYLPPTNPTRYRVRRLDLRTEEVVGVYTVDAELQEAMEGTARVQASSPDGRRLYTLYTLAGPDGTRRAFVHVLSLDELWAHCVDLPPAFEMARERSIAIAVAPDGRRLYVADADTGTVAEVDTEALAVTRTVQAAFGSRGGTAQGAVGSDGRLYLGKGSGLSSLDVSTLSAGRSWEMDGPITGIQVANDGDRVYVGLKDRIVVLDSATGETLGELDPANVGSIAQLGQSTSSLEEGRTEIECAC
jgi:YVTN family beta-propeller protein